MNSALNKKHPSHLQDGSKDVEPTVECNSNLQRARFQGVSMQRRSSFSERSLVLSLNSVGGNNNKQQYKNNSFNNKSEKTILSAQRLPSLSLKQSNSISNKQSSINKSSSKRNSDFTQHDVSTELETNKKKNKLCSSRRKIFLYISISLLIIIIIVLSIVLPLKLTNSKTTSPSNQLTTSQNLACLSGGLICSTPMFHWNYFCNPTSYNYYSCCYLSPLSTQLTIEFQLQEDISYWSIDDISATQNNGELIINGGFESNLNGWILTISSNATLTTYVDTQASSSHTGSAYLYSRSQNAPVYLKQTFNIIQGQNINISFWWADKGSSVYIPGKLCQATVRLI